MAIGLIGSLASGIMSMSSASSAANAQERASQDQIALARETRDLTRADLAPYVQSGSLGQQAYLNTLGLGSAPMIGGVAPQVETYQIPGAMQSGQQRIGPGGSPTGRGGVTGSPTTGYRVGDQTFITMEEAQAYANSHMTGGTAWGGYEQSPGYQFSLQQGQDALQSAALANGMGASGRTLRDAQTFGQGIASQDYGNFQNRLAALGQSGQSAAGMQADANTNYANMGTNALGNLGNAQAAGSIGVGNAFSDMMGNIMGGYGYMKSQPKATPGTGLW